jgi:hypothetical protein
MNVWSPQQRDLDEILTTIFESTSSTNQAVQRSITHVSSSFISFIHHPQMIYFVPLCSVITETQQLYPRARLYRLSRIHPFRPHPTRRSYQDHRRLPPQE